MELEEKRDGSVGEVNYDENGNGAGDEKPHDNTNFPVDRGWSWMIAVAVFLLYAIYGGIHFTTSVLLLDILEYMDINITTYTIQLALNQICYGISSQVSANILAMRFSVRKMATVSSVVNVLATLLLVSSTNMSIFMVAMCIKTTFHGITLVPSVSLIGFYFEKKRAFAMAFCILGLSFGACTVPVLINFLRQEYGFRGCLLLYGAVEMHAIPISLLLRPLSSYRTKRQKSNGRHSSPEIVTGINATDSEAKGHLVTRVESENWYKPVTSTLKNEAEFHSLLEKSSNSENYELSTTHNTLSEEEKYNMSGQLLMSSPTPESESEDTTKLSDIKEQELSGTKTIAEGLLTGESSIIPMTAKRRSHTNNKGPVTISQHSTRQRNAMIKFFNTLIDFKLIKKPLAISALLSYNLFNQLIFLNAYVPAFGVEMGASPSQGALLLTISGMVDIFSKLFVGFLTDLKVMAPYKIIIIGSVCIGGVCQLTAFFDTFGTLVFFAICLGFFGGTGVSLNSVHVIELLGVNSLSKMLALGIFTFSITSLVQNLLIGVLIDRTGSFRVVMHYCGINYILASLVLSLVPLTRKLQTSLERKQEENQS